MERQLALAMFIKSHKDLTIEQIKFIKEALKFYEDKFGELDDDYELEVKCAIEIYCDHIEQKYR